MKRPVTKNGNGHTHPAPAMATLEERKRTIPMESDFTSF